MIKTIKSLNYSYLQLINGFTANYFMKRFSTVKEIFALFIHKRKFHMFPIIILLIALIGITALAQSGLVAFIYPI